MQVLSSFVFLDTTGWSAGEVCSGSPIAEPVPRRLVSASFENASRIRPCRSVCVFGQDGHRVVRPEGMPPRVEVEVFGHLDPYHVMTAMYGRYSINGLKS